MAVNKALEKLLAAAGIPASTPRYVATQESAWAQQGGTLFFNAELEDGGRNTVEGWGTLDVNTGFVYLALYRFGTGALLADAVVTPAAGMKADTASMWLRQDNQGPYVRLRFGNHQSGPGQPEGLSRDIFDWRPVGLVAIPDGAPREGRYGGYPASGDSTMGLTDADKTFIQQQLEASLNEFDARLGGQAPREDIKGLIQEVLTTMGVLTLPLTRAGGDADYYRQQVNTAFTGALGALHTAGLVHAPQAMATPASDVVNAAQAVPDTLAEKGKQAQAEEEWNKYPKGQAIGTEGEQPKKEGE